MLTTIGQRPGYQVMFVNGVAQPTNQIANNTLGALPIAVDTSRIFYRGLGRHGSDLVD